MAIREYGSPASAYAMDLITILNRCHHFHGFVYFRGFYTVIGDDLASKIVFVCSDMWEPYLKLNGEEPIMRRKVAGPLSLLVPGRGSPDDN